MLARVTRKDLVNQRSLVYFDYQEKAETNIDDFSDEDQYQFRRRLLPKAHP
jgi:hypothetical protein